jgi:hypothetical protein
MMSTRLPLPSARIRPTPDNWARVCRSLSPLPPNALAALSMKRPIELLATLPLGPKSVASRISWSLISSHSTGTAVRCTGITAPSPMVGPLDR